MKKLYWCLHPETFVSDKNQFLANVSSGGSQTPAYPRLSFRLWWAVLLLLLGGVVNSYAQCTLTINKVTTSGCYSVGGVSKATVSIEVGWNNAPANGYIVVTTAAQSKTITPGTISVVYPQVSYTVTGSQTIVSPQVVAFEINATGTTGTVTAAFSNSPACSATASYTAPAGCLPTSCSGNNIGGIVFKDFNDDGIQQTGESVGIASVTVKAIACDGTPYTAITDQYGRYAIPLALNKYPVRVEFSNIPGVYNLGINGSDSRTSVQIINAPNCDVNLGVNNPVDYCSSTPQIFVPCYVYGDPLVSGSSSALSDALVTIPYGVTAATTFTGEQPIATAAQIGTVWGLAYNKNTKRLFQSAVLKRHAGLGPAGLGGIYVTNYSNPSAPVTSTFLNVTTIGINVGTIASNSARGLVGDKTQPSYDQQSFAQIAKIGIGDLDISEDGDKLWLINMNDKKLYSIDISQYNVTGATPTTANVASYTIPASCSGGAYRPWALKVYNGKVYVGGVCDAQSSGSKSNLRASVYELNGSTFTQIFDFPLTYPKGYPAFADVNNTGWYPWTDNFDDLRQSGQTILRHPVPIFTDIEFDIDGSMVLAFGDRTGFQGGDYNYRPDGAATNNTTTYEVNSQAGDLLRAFYANGVFVLENNAKAGPATGYGQNNSQGPGFGEFYNDNWIQENGTTLYHAENIMGGLALRPGSGEVVVTTIDPNDLHPYAGGVRYMNNSSGQLTGAYTVYITRGPDVNNTNPGNPGTFAKATGLGDIELSCNTIELLQIGNRVWLDDDKDGEQDACEKGLSGVSVSLYQGSTLIARTLTDANGEYYFPNYASPSSVTFAGSQTALVPNTAYQLVFGTSSQFSSGTLTVANGKYLLTTANATGGNLNDLNDSDAAVATVAGITAPVISLTTDAIGTSDHTFDVGFYCQTITSGTISVTQATCNLTNNTANNNGRITVSGIINGDKAAIVAFGGTVPSYTATTNVTITGGVASFSGLANPTATTGTSYSIIIYNGPCCTAVVTSLLPRTDCTCGLNATVTVGNCNQVNNQYSVSGTISLTNTPAGSFTVTDGTRSSVVSVTAGQPSVAFSITGLNSNGVAHTVSVVSSGTACGSTSLTYQAPVSCTVAASIAVTSATVCYGNSATLTTSGCNGTVSWSNSTTGTSLITPNLTQTTNYTATCTTVTQTTFAVGTVTVYPQPVLTLNASSTFVTQATPVSLSAIGCVGNVLWSTAQTTPVISVTPMNSTQTYSATCTTGPGCFTTASITVTTLPPASITASSATICYGSSATLVATGCSSGSIAWSNGTTGSTLSIPSLTATTSYTATCSTPTGSTASSVGTVTVYPQPVLTLNASSTFVTQATPVSLSAIGCVGNVLWSTAQTTPVISVTPMNSTQTYSATCTTGPGCFTTASITVTTLPPASITASSATICYGSSATLVATGCSSGTIAWSNGTTGSTLSIPSLTATTSYTATCSTPTGSTASSVGTVTVYPQPVLTLNASSTFVTQATPVSLSAIGCVGNVLWSTAQTTPVISVTPMNSTQTYSATCTTGPGCFTTASITVTTLPPASITASSATICYGSSATLVATGCSSGTIAWSNGTTGSTLSIPSLTATTSYTATCSTPTGSTASSVGTVTVYPQPVLTLNASSTFVTQATPVSLSAIGCVGNVTWSTAQTTPVISVTPMNSTQTYLATCTTGPGCFTTASITVTTLPPASITASSATICYGSSATLVATGCSSGTIAWSNGTTGSTLSIPSLTATTSYTATCSTPTGSTASSVGTVTVYPQPVLSINASSTFVTQATPVSLSAIGCVGNVLWSTAQTTPVISVTPMNSTQTYSATCTTGPGCFTTASITVTTLPPASITASSATICYGSSATLVATGCSSGTIAWSNGTTGSTLSIPSLTATTSYTATCSTPTGSVSTAVGTVTVYPQPVLSLNASSTFVTQATPVSLSAIGCVGNVAWSTAGAGSTITVTPMNSTQTYSATCTTGPGCFTTASITISTLPPASLTAASTTVCLGSSATLVAVGCTSGSVVWSNGTTGSALTIASLTTTTSYTATCTTPTGSVSSVVATAFVETPASLTISRTAITAGQSVTVSVRGCNGSTIWSTGDMGSAFIIVPANLNATYSVTCTSPLGCSSTAKLTIGNLNPNDFTVGDAITCQSQSATLTAVGCQGTLIWTGTGTNGQTTASIVVTPAQTTAYTVACTNGTDVTELVAQVTVVPAPSLTLTVSSLTVTEGDPLSITALGCDIGQLIWSLTGVTGNVLSTTANLTTSTYSVTCALTPTCLDVKSVTVTVIPLLPQLNLTKVVSKTRANLGEVISYTVTLSNTGNAPATNVVVEDVLSAGLAYVPNSASVSLGTIAAGTTGSNWSIASLAAGQTATLVLSASILAEGVHYNTARIPGDTATTCVSVAYRVCQGSDYAIRILGPVGYTRYQWYNGTQLVAETTTNSYTATAAGEYKVVVDNGNGTCPDGSCCPVIIEEVAIPSTFTVAGTNPSCVALTPQNNGVLTVSGLGTDLTGYRYAISEGSSFTATNPTTQPVPANGVIATTLTAPKTYTVRVYDQLGCYADRTVTLSADCVCPPAICVPISVKKIVRP